MSGKDSMYNSMMQTSVTSDSSTLSGLATGPVPGSALGTGVPPGGGSFDTDASYAVMNDKVQALAGSIYEELERMITKYDQVGLVHVFFSTGIRGQRHDNNLRRIVPLSREK
jgi:phosphoribosylformylglycinamidine (FGAM) synthase-like enzyme